ncbi:hypothetical protein [Geomicrobium sp. JCM 19055]|nr:hypothetical protein [Geomicrobium sp. JCM 19055]
MHEIQTLCDRILLLKNGDVFMEGTVQEVLSKVEQNRWMTLTYN